MTAPELMNCPFCGHGADLIIPADGSRPYIMCWTNFCTGPKATAAEAIAAWNTRTPDPLLAEALEALRGLRAVICEAFPALAHTEVIRSTDAVLAKMDAARAGKDPT